MGSISASLSGNVQLPDVRPAVFGGPHRTGMAVQFYGMLRSCCSLSNVSSQVARQLLAHVGDTSLVSYSGQPFFETGLEPHAGLDRTARVGVFYGVPDAVPPFFFDHQTTIGGFVCETDEIPGRWVRRCNRFDLVLVPSRFCRAAFQRSGVTTPIALAPHGLEPEYVPTDGPCPGDRFVFYDVVNSACQRRKSCEELIRCFRLAFAGRRDVRLRLRTKRTPAVERWLETYRARDLVEVDQATGCSTAQFAAVYSQVHCTVHPSRGEGFGLIPFQSIACETPVIAPQTTGMADYLDEHNAMVLGVLDVTDDVDVYYRRGTYPQIDEDHLVELLRHAEQCWVSEKAKVQAIAAEFRSRNSWDNALAGVMSLVRDLAETSSADDRHQRIRAHCSSEGRAEAVTVTSSRTGRA